MPKATQREGGAWALDPDSTLWPPPRKGWALGRTLSLMLHLH